MMGPHNFEAEIFAYIQSKVGDPATADDLTQETFVKVSRALTKGPTSEHFREWLYPSPEVREEWGLATATQPSLAKLGSLTAGFAPPRNLVLCPIVKFRGARRLVSGHLLGVLARQV
jgi:hypothetical protein